MSQPFRIGNRFESAVWPGLRLELLEDRIEAAAPVMLRTLASAVHLGGFAEADRIVNWKVPLAYRCDDPAADTASRIRHWGLEPDRTVGLLTAAKLTHAAVREERGDRFALLCCTTAGTSNAAAAGCARETFPAYAPGTINTMLLVDGRLTDAAMVNAVITATEAKAAALRDLGIADADTGRLATGTTTDAVAIGASNDERHGGIHAYAGTATTIGNAIGRLVYETVHEAVRTQQEG